MKSKDLGILSFSLVLCVLLIAGGFLISCSKKAEEPVIEEPTEDFTFHGDGELDPTVKEKLIKVIGQDNQALAEYFDGGKSEESIRDTLGDDAVLTKENGETIRGSTEIIAYLSTLIGTVTEIKVKTKHVHVKTLKHIKNIPEPTDPADKEKWLKDIIDVFYIITSITYKKDGNFIDPPLFTTRKHTRICDIGY